MGESSDGNVYRVALAKAFGFANEFGRPCGPVELLVGVSESGDVVAETLRAGDGRSLREVVTTNSAVVFGGAFYVGSQAQGGAKRLADNRGRHVTPAHLLVALIDQAAPEVLQVLRLAGIDPAQVRIAALAAMGEPADLPRVPLPPLVPAGTMDRPPLPLSDLDTRAWAWLCWRQEHLPLRHVRRRSDWWSLSNLERRAVEQVAERLGLDDDQRYSLAQYHVAEVERRVAEVRPGLVELRRTGASGRTILVHRPAERWWQRPRSLRFTVGWGIWFGNRRAGLRSRWFRARAARAYRGARRADHGTVPG